MNKRYLKNLMLVRINDELLRKIYNAPNGKLILRDKDCYKPFYWTVKQEYRCGEKHGDVLIWEKHRVFDGALLAEPEVTPIELTGAVLLHQGRKTTIIKYRPGLRKAMDDAGVHCFYNKPPTIIYSDVSSRVEAYFAGVPNPVICAEMKNEYGYKTKRYGIPHGSDLVVQTRFEPGGDITRIVFGSSYVRVKKYLESILSREIEEFQNTWLEQLGNTAEFDFTNG